MAKRLEELDELVEALRAQVRSDTTRHRYARQWQRFAAWADEWAVSSHSPVTLARYLAHQVDVAGWGSSSVDQAVAAVAAVARAEGWPDPTVAPIVRELARGRRRRAPAPEQAPPLSLEALREICGKLRASGLTERPRDLRDRAVMVIGWLSGLRRAELSALDDADVSVSLGPQRREARPALVLRLRSSKTTDEVDGAQIIVLRGGVYEETDPVRAWVEYRAVVPREFSTRAAFVGSTARNLTNRRMSGRAVARCVERGVALIDPEGAPAYSAHSLRAGLATELASRGADVLALKRAGRWLSLRALERYIRLGDAWSSSPHAPIEGDY